MTRRAGDRNHEKYETRNLLISKQEIHDKEQDEKQISKRQQTTQI